MIAIVTDSLTDLDIFKDLQEACTLRGVPVYILLDESSVTAFLQMCKSIGAHLDELQVCVLATTTTSGGVKQKKRKSFLVRFWFGFGPPAASESFSCLKNSKQKMRVRTITGTTYYMRSGGRVTGQVHERFMLIDGIKVATGSYR